MITYCSRASLSVISIKKESEIAWTVFTRQTLFHNLETRKKSRNQSTFLGYNFVLNLSQVHFAFSINLQGINVTSFLVYACRWWVHREWWELLRAKAFPDHLAASFWRRICNKFSELKKCLRGHPKMTSLPRERRSKQNTKKRDDRRWRWKNCVTSFMDELYSVSRWKFRYFSVT